MMEEMRRLFAHARWADERALEALRGAAQAPAEALKVYAHVLGAEHTWLSRLRGEAPEVAVWPALGIEECAALALENADGYDAYLDSLAPDDFASEVEYRNSAGDRFRTRIDDILLHVALHGSYHRGQIAMLLRQHGAAPLPTDYIAYVRGVPAATTRV